MNKQGYVTLGVALLAALGVHAFALFYVNPASQQHVFVGATPIQVDLLSQQLKTHQQSLPQPTVQDAPPQKALEHHKKQSALKKSVVEVDYQQIKYSYSPARKKQSQSDLSEQEQRNRAEQVKTSQGAIGVLSLSKMVQARVLANIQYPRQARRRGWQGKSEFEFAVQNQLITHLTMLVSSGYEALDRAAYKGIRSMQNISIEDGCYRLPVEFRLHQSP